YYAHVDRAPVLVLGATGPVDRTKRRPHIDWIHTAQVNANAVRDYTKWDDQPATVADFPASFARAYRMATTEPAGPVYVCYDAALQEEKLDRPIDVSAVAAGARPSPAQADPAAIARAAELLAHAERPVILTEFTGRHADPDASPPGPPKGPSAAGALLAAAGASPNPIRRHAPAARRRGTPVP